MIRSKADQDSDRADEERVKLDYNTMRGSHAQTLANTLMHDSSTLRRVRNARFET